MGGYAWVTLATNDSYSLGALVLAHSLRKSNTAHKLAVLITPAVSQPMREQLQTVFDVVKTVDVLDSKDEAHLALMKRPELGITFTKIHCWRLTEFEKCVFLDADTLVVRNCDELFQREEFSAAPDVSWPDCFNSGVFVYKPSVETFNKLLQFAVEKGSFDGGDQGLLNQFFSDWATEDIKKHLPFVYNLTSVAAYSYIPAFKQYGAETRIVHFIGTGKPWLHQLDPATRTVTPTSGSEHLAPLLQQWWDLFCEKVHPNLSKNLESNNDGMSHLPVEACSNTPVALTSDEPRPPRLIEPCLQYREKDDYRQHNLPYQPFDVKGSSGELLNVEFLLASVVPPGDSEEQQRRDGNELEEKDTKPEVQEEPSETDGEQTIETESEIVGDERKEEEEEEEEEEKKEEASAPKDPFDYNTFFPDEKCVNNYLEQNVLTYQPFKPPQEDPQPQNIPLPRFLTMPEDDQRQKGNAEIAEHRQAPEPPPPPPIRQEQPVEFQRRPTPPPPVEKHELPKSKSMTFISSDVVAAVTPRPPVRSIWKSQPDVNVDVNRKYSMPKLKPLLPRQNSRSIKSPIPRVTLYTEFLMSADYKDPVDIPKDEVGFVETELRRSKSETDLKGKFGPLPYAKSPVVEIPEPKKPPLRELDNDAYDLTRCKRQLGNKPRDEKKENVTPSKYKISNLIKKRKSKELSPDDEGDEKRLKRERKERRTHKKNENVDRILKRLWEFSKNYQHYFGVNAQNGAKERSVQSEFNQFRNFVKDKKETTQKGLLGIQDMMAQNADGTKVRNENIRCKADLETPKIVNGLGKAGDKNLVVTPKGKGKIQREKSTREEEVKKQSPDRCKASTDKQPTRHLDVKVNADCNKPGTHFLIALENISNGQNNVETEVNDKHSRNIKDRKIEEAASIENGCTRRTDTTDEHSTISMKVREAITQNERSDNSKSETPSNGCLSLPKPFEESPTSEKTGKDEKLSGEIKKPTQPDLLSECIRKQPEKEMEDGLCTLSSRTQEVEGSENTEKTVTRGTQTNKESPKVKEDKKAEEPSSEKVKSVSEQTETQPQSNIKTPAINGEDKDTQPSTAVVVSNVRQEPESGAQCQKISERQEASHENTTPSDVLDSTLPERNNVPHDSKVVDAQETAPVDESTPEKMFTIGSPEDPLSSLSVKQTVEIPQTSKVRDSIPKPDEILCVPDFETPRSSRILTSNLKPDTDATPQAPPSSPVATPRKARIQRKPYENGTKHRSPAGKRTVKTGNSKHRAGIAGAIAQLNLEAGGKAGDSEATSAAHQEYIRRQNWETGNMDYMGRDSFENIWSKICQTLEGKELDKATESTQSPVTISTEEKAKRKGVAGAETPEFINTLPSEPVTGPVEDDEIIFSKPEIRQTSLTNIKEEEENGGPTEGGSVKLSDILKPMLKPQTIAEEVAKVPTIAPAELSLDRKLPEEAKTDEKPQADSISTVSTSSDSAEQIKSGSELVGGTADNVKAETEPSKCTTVAICQPISMPGASPEVQTAAKTPAQKIAEKKLQQKPETPTEPIPLPAPESPTQTECKTVAIPYPAVIAALADEKQPPVEQTAESAPLISPEMPVPASSKDEKQKKGVFSKLLEMVGVAPKTEEASKSVFYDVKEDATKAEGSVVPKAEESVKEDAPKAEADVQEVNKESQSTAEEELKPLSDSKPGDRAGTSEKEETPRDADQTVAPEMKQKLDGSTPDSGKPDSEAEKKKSGSGSRKSDQAPMPKPARNASPKFSPQATKNKSPSPLTIPQTPPETALTVATPPPPPEPPKRRNSALLKVDESIPVTPPVPESAKETAEPTKSEIENIIEKAKTEVESILQDRRSAEKEGDESDLINAMKLMMGAESQSKAEEVEELKVTTEEERQRHKGEVASSKLSDQILKAIPPPRRKAISESKPEASGSSGAIPKTPSGEKPKHKPSSIPVPPPRNKGKPSTPAPPKGKTKK